LSRLKLVTGEESNEGASVGGCFDFSYKGQEFKLKLFAEKGGAQVFMGYVSVVELPIPESMASLIDSVGGERPKKEIVVIAESTKFRWFDKRDRKKVVIKKALRLKNKLVSKMQREEDDKRITGQYTQCLLEYTPPERHTSS
jgi:hypothetical protein